MSDIAKFTPGPWEVGRSMCGHYPAVRKNFRPDHHMEVCGPVHGYMYSADEKAEQAANARLIAAAPELYEALELLALNIVHAFPSMKDLGPITKAAAALAKARGEA